MPRKSKSLVFESSQKKPYTYVWRIQGKDGRGPYQQKLVKRSNNRDENFNYIDAGYVWSEGAHNENTGRPAYDVDSGFDRAALHYLYDPTKDCRFGFKNKAQLRKWFTAKELANLEKMGFSLVKVKAKKVWDSGVQVFFEVY